jgi:threonine aldolase
MKSWNSVITASTAHLEQTNAVLPKNLQAQRFSPLIRKMEKSLGYVEKHMHGFDFEHHSQPKVISITQSTEMGTVYTADEIRSIADKLIHMGCCFTWTEQG